MKKLKLILIFSIFLCLIYAAIKFDSKKDWVWNLKNTLHPKVIFQLKKVYIIYFHDFKNNIILKKDRKQKILSSQNREFELITYQNKIFKKNGPKAFIKIYNNNLFLITGSGLLSFTEFKNIDNEKLNLKFIRNNLRNIFGTENIIKNPGLVLNMNISNNNIYISYVNEVSKDCFNTSVLKGEINFKNINFKKIFSPKNCIKKKNSYGEFYILEAGGAIEFINKNNFFLSTGTFRFRDLSQIKDNIFGKILMIDLDNKNHKIISIGHRNIQGMLYDHNNDILFSIDHGPQGGDEINLNFSPFNKRIKNYGWPIASYGEHYGGKIKKNKIKYKKAPLYKSHEKYGFIEPQKFFVPSIAPSDILFVPKEFDLDFKNNIYVSSLGFKNDNGRRSIHTFNLDNNFQLENHEIIPLNDRVRDIEYFKKSNSILLFLEKTASVGILKKY